MTSQSAEECLSYACCSACCAAEVRRGSESGIANHLQCGQHRADFAGGKDHLNGAGRSGGERYPTASVGTAIHCELVVIAALEVEF